METAGVVREQETDFRMEGCLGTGSEVVHFHKAEHFVAVAVKIVAEPEETDYKSPDYLRDFVLILILRQRGATLV